MTGEDILRLMRQANSPFLRGLEAAAEYLGVSRATVCRWKKAGKLNGAFCQLSGVVLFEKNVLNQFIKNKKAK